MKKTHIKFWFSIVLLIIFTTNSYAQIVDNIYWRDSNKKKIIDTCKYAVTYKFEFIYDTIKKEKLYDKQVLEVGEKISKYYSVYADKIDSVWYIVTKKPNKHDKSGGDGIDAEKEAGLQKNEHAIYEDIFINYPKNGILTLMRKIHENEYMYEEPIPKFNWKMQTDTATILGYKCMKATATFRGRTYNAWFTPFIPIHQGMWKFNGLPGLILKAEDTKGYFKWTAASIEKTHNRNIFKHDFEKAVIANITRENLMKLLHKRWQDPIGLIFANTTGLQSFVVGKKWYNRGEATDFQRPYIPIPELE